MHAAPAPVRGDLARADVTLRITGLVHRTFPPGSDRIDDAFSERHFADLTAPYGVRVRPDVAARADANSFTTMTARLLADLPVRDLDGHSPELVVVAHATPDLDCRLAAATHLSDVLPGGPLVFGVSDCGSAAPFAALRLAVAYARRHRYRRVLLLALDQATLPYDTGVDLAGDAGAALLLTVGNPGTRPDDLVLRPRPPRFVDGDVLPAVLSDVLEEPDETAGSPVSAVLTGPGVDPDRLPADERIVPAPRGFPAGGLLGAFAAHRALRDPGAGPVALVDHEPASGELNVCLAVRGGP